MALLNPEGQHFGSDDAKRARSVVDAVPTVYYDLIARVCPGAGFWITISLVSPEVLRVFNIEKLSWASLVILVLISYLAGIVLSGFCLVWDGISYKILSGIKNIRAPLGLSEVHGLTKQWQLVAQNMEAVAKAAQDPGRIVTKALAEVTLCQNLLTGLAVLGVVGLYSQGKHFFNPVDFIYTYAIIAAALFLAMIFRQTMFLGRTQALYELYVGCPEVQSSSRSTDVAK